MQSDIQRRSVHHWFDGTLLTRLNDPETGVIIIVMQRLHQDDLIGHVLEGQDWHVLQLPALAEQDETHEFMTPFGMQRFSRREGEALHPARFSLARLRAIRETVGNFYFSAQYQQRPVPVEGNLIKPEWLERRFNLAQFQPEPYYTYQSWDTAIKSGDLNDYSVCTTWVRVGHDFYLIDVFRRKLDYPDLKAALIAQHERYHPTETLVEDKGSGTQLIQEAEAAGIYGVIGVIPPSARQRRFSLQAASFSRPRRPGSPSISRKSSAFQEPGMTIKSTPLRRHSNTCAANQTGSECGSVSPTKVTADRIRGSHHA
jgi:phage terminase large subunit-like protein